MRKWRESRSRGGVQKERNIRIGFIKYNNLMSTIRQCDFTLSKRFDLISNHINTSIQTYQLLSCFIFTVQRSKKGKIRHTVHQKHLTPLLPLYTHHLIKHGLNNVYWLFYLCLAYPYKISACVRHRSIVTWSDIKLSKKFTHRNDDMWHITIFCNYF